MKKTASSNGHYPDPVLTANVYAAGQLDNLIVQPLSSFWRRLEEQFPEDFGYLWIMRYPCRGEHLKIRVHGEAALKGGAEDLLQETMGTYLASLLEEVEIEPERAGSKAPPIDLEDRGEGLHPDHSLVLTRYRRSHIALGGEPFLSDDNYAAAITRCMGAACELLLETTERQGGLPHKTRQSTLLKAVTSGFCALGFDDKELQTYLGYHRDWLIRFTLFKAGSPVEKGMALLGRFEQRAEKMANTLGSLAEAMEATLHSSLSTREESAESSSTWGQSLLALHRYVEPLGQLDSHRIDPFSPAPSFPAIFKTFHSFANSLGLDMLNEAFAYHLLLRAAVGQPLELSLAMEPT